jgi:hypothetical protein
MTTHAQSEARQKAIADAFGEAVKASAYASHVCAWSVRCGQRPTATFDGKRYCDHHHEQVVRRSRATTRDR